MHFPEPKLLLLLSELVLEVLALELLLSGPTRAITLRRILVSQTLFDRCNLFELPLKPVCAHQGEGQVSFHRILTQEHVQGQCHFMDFTVMQPGTSIGLHRHQESEEEYYLILSGSGEMTKEGETFQVKAGDFIRNEPGGTHALRNTGLSELHLFVFELAVSK